MRKTVDTQGILLFAAFGLALFILPSVSFGKPAISAGAIDNYLAQKTSPLTTNGSVFVTHGAGFRVDPRLIIAIAGAETTFGQFTCASFNAWNWFWNSNCQKSPFSSWTAGIETVTRFIRLSYLTKGYTTIPLIGSKYCAQKCDNWVPLVTLFYQDELGGDTRDLEF